MESLKIPEEFSQFVPEEQVIPSPRGYTEAYELIETFNTITSQMFKAWQFHFQYLNLAYLAYLMFIDTARKLFPGIKESTIGKMVAGADVSMFRPEEELCRLSRLAIAQPPVSNILKKDIPAEEKIKELNILMLAWNGLNSWRGSRTRGSTSPAEVDGITTRAVGSTKWMSLSVT